MKTVTGLNRAQAAASVLLPCLLTTAGIATLPYAAVNAHADNPRHTIVGAIRWDAWVGDAATFVGGGNYTGLQVARTLGPGRWHYRLPFFARITGPDSVYIDGRTQAIMDQEIAYAKNAGLDYWCFHYYHNGSGLDAARNLYLGSRHKHDVKFCISIENGRWNQAATDLLVDWFQLDNYQKVLGNRPLFYIFNLAPDTEAKIATLRAACVAKGMPEPYVVAMRDTAMAGIDAFSSYTGGATPGNPGTRQYIPNASAGMASAPRTENKWFYGGYAEANAVLMYAWNEHDEGGWLCPTLFYGADRLNAIATVLGGQQQPTRTPAPPAGTNLASGATATCSSHYGTDGASKAIDGSGGSGWQANGSHAGEWLAIDFGQATKFNQVIIKSLFPRVQQYMLQYDDGGVWKTCASDLWMTPHTPVKLNKSYTSSKLRVYIVQADNKPIINELEVYHLNFGPPPSPLPQPGGVIKTWKLSVNTLNWQSADLSTPIRETIDLDLHKVIEIKLKNNTSSSEGKIKFTTWANGMFTEHKSHRFKMVPNDPDYTTYSVDMTDVPDWKSGLKQLRIESGSKSGSLSIDYITVARTQ